ncbi:MAG: NAD-binding protein [Treponema sp.]|nr:NAD-binding protein [Treponema sp.]
MKIVIIGAGFTGVQLAKRLIDEGNKVSIIDNSLEIVSNLQDTLDCDIRYAEGNNLETLEDVGIATADALVAVTESDEINMITCSLVDSIYPDVLKIARVRNESYYVSTKETEKKIAGRFEGARRPLYGIDYMINPDVEAAQAIVNAVEHGVSDVMPLGEDDESDYELSKITVAKGSRLDGCAVKNIRNVTDISMIVVLVEEDSGNVFFPTGDTQILAGQTISVLSHKDDLQAVQELCGVKLTTIKKIVLLGIGKVGTMVTERLMQPRLAQQKKKEGFFRRLLGKKRNASVQDFVIVDSDRERCDAAIEKFSDSVRIFQQDITDESFIEQEGLSNFDLCICATHNHELNLMVAAYLEVLGLKRTIALITNSAFSPIAIKMGVDVPVPIRDTVVDSIMSHLRGKSVTEVHTVSNGECEIIECDIPSGSSVIGKKLKDIARPGEFLMLLIKKPGAAKNELTNGDTYLNVGDHVTLAVKTGDQKILGYFSGTK